MARNQRAERLLALYNMTEEEWSGLHVFVEGRCPICRRKTMLVTDHDHTDGHIRGLLCRRCNATLREWVDIDWLTKALAYLADMPADKFFGTPRFGRPGRVTNKRRGRRGRKPVRREP
jgi:hypothetical protein